MASAIAIPYTKYVAQISRAIVWREFVAKCCITTDSVRRIYGTNYDRRLLAVVLVVVVFSDNIVLEFKQYELSDLTRNFVGAAKIALSTLFLSQIL